MLVEVLCWINRVYDLPKNVRVVPVIQCASKSVIPNLFINAEPYNIF